MNEATIFWDWDGTLFDSLGVFLRIYNSFTYKDLSPEQFREKLNEGWMDDVMRELEKKKAFSNILVETLKVMMKDTRLFKGIPEIVKNSGSNYIVSSSLRPIILEKLIENGMVEHFKDIITADVADTPFKKDLVKYALEKTGADPSNTIYIGDMVEDVLAAKEFGIKCIAVVWGFNTKKQLEDAGPDIVVETPEELFKAIKRLNG
jgi:HAD superfamily hydrolase (TIGR01549 family)